MSHTISLTVTQDDGQWVITHVNAALVTRTATTRGNYDVAEVLQLAEQMASGEVLWRTTDAGFEGVVRSDVTGWPLPTATGPTAPTGEVGGLYELSVGEYERVLGDFDSEDEALIHLGRYAIEHGDQAMHPHITRID